MNPQAQSAFETYWTNEARYCSGNKVSHRRTWQAAIAQAKKVAKLHRLDDKNYFGNDGRLIDPTRQPTIYEMGEHNTAVSIFETLRRLGE